MFSTNLFALQFRQLSTLANHMKIHTGEKPFSEWKKEVYFTLNSMGNFNELFFCFPVNDLQNVMCVRGNSDRARRWQITSKFTRERNHTVSNLEGVYRLQKDVEEASVGGEELLVMMKKFWRWLERKNDEKSSWTEWKIEWNWYEKSSRFQGQWTEMELQWVL